MSSRPHLDVVRNGDATAADDPLTAMIKAAVRNVLREELPALLAAPEPDYRTRNEEAQRLGVSLATLDKMVRDDGLPYVVVSGCRRFVKNEVDAHLRALRANRGPAQ